MRPIQVKSSIMVFGLLALSMWTWVFFMAVSAAPIIIDFESLPAPGAVTTQYQSAYGVALNGAILRDYSFSPGFAHSGTKAIGPPNCNELFCDDIVITFNAALQSRVKIWVGYWIPTVATTVSLSAFDQNGNPVQTASTTFQPSEIPIPIQTPLEVTGNSNIYTAKVRVTPQPPQASGLAVDDVEFDTGPSSTTISTSTTTSTTSVVSTWTSTSTSWTVTTTGTTTSTTTTFAPCPAPAQSSPGVNQLTTTTTISTTTTTATNNSLTITTTTRTLTNGSLTITTTTIPCYTTSTTTSQLTVFSPTATLYTSTNQSLYTLTQPNQSVTGTTESASYCPTCPPPPCSYSIIPPSYVYQVIPTAGHSTYQIVPLKVEENLGSGPCGPIQLTVVSFGMNCSPPCIVGQLQPPASGRPPFVAYLEVTVYNPANLWCDPSSPGVTNMGIMGSAAPSPSPSPPVPTVTATVPIHLRDDAGVCQSKCLIATAAYGSDLAPEVRFLRGLRDDKILRTLVGRQFMVAFNAWYYSFSPQVAAYLTSHPVERTIMKAVLYPLIGILMLASGTFYATSQYPELAALIAGLVASSMIGAFYLGLPLSLLLAKIRRLGGRRAQKMVEKSLLIVLVGNFVALLLGEVFVSPIAVMLSSSGIVLSTLFLSATFTSRKIAGKLRPR